MSAESIIEDLYDRCTGGLGKPQRAWARALARAIGLTGEPRQRRRELFANDALRELPAFFADAMPALDTGLVRDAVTAHMLGIMATLAANQIRDGFPGDPPAALVDVVNALRAARDFALERVGPGRLEPMFDYRLGEADAAAARAEEARLLRWGIDADFTTYERLAVAEGHAMFPATMRLALAAGWDGRRIHLVREAIGGVVVGFRMVDDARSWKERLAHGGTWAANLTGAFGKSGNLFEVERCVYASGIVGLLCKSASGQLDEVRRAAEELDALPLSTWAEDTSGDFLALATSQREVTALDPPREDIQAHDPHKTGSIAGALLRLTPRVAKLIINEAERISARPNLPADLARVWNTLRSRITSTGSATAIPR
jgi:hypothetical protein